MTGRVRTALVCAFLLAPAAQARKNFYDPGPNTSRITVAGPQEPGDRLVVSGTVYKADGATPAPAVVLYVYQTDHTGLYNAHRGAPPRLRGWMRTDAQGRYEYSTVRPAPYPGGRIAAHVHTQLWGGGFPPQWNTELLFANDPRVPDHERHDSAAAGRFAWVCAPEPRDGAARCTHNLRLKPAGDRFEESTEHGLFGPTPGGE